MRAIHFPAVAALLVTAGCASTATSSSDPAPVQGPRWSGLLQPAQQRSGSLAVTGQNRVTGTVLVAPVPNTGRMQVRLTIAMPVSGSTTVGWAVAADRCGSNALPLLGYEQFPQMEVGSNGRGELSVELPLDLRGGGTYHVNVYQSGRGHQLDAVITCANLRFQGATTP